MGCNTGIFGPTGYQYPVSEGTECADVQLPQQCKNPKTNAIFWCGHDDQCCGGACVAKDGVCCTNEHGDGFGCAKDNTCCGNACAKQVLQDSHGAVVPTHEEYQDGGWRDLQVNIL